jgi:hypothetical protein
MEIQMDLKSSINIVCIFIIYLRYTANITRKNNANSSSNIEKTGSRFDK